MCVALRYAVPYMQYVHVMRKHSSFFMNGRVASRPTGFSMNQFLGFRYEMIRRADITRESANLKLRTPHVLARLYSVHGGLAAMMSKCPGE
jgi:hypothetical protein